MDKKHTIRIRAARDDERDTIRDLTLAAYEEYARIMAEPVWQGYRRQLLATLDSEGPVERIVAEQDDTLVGSVLLYPPATNAYGKATAGSAWPEVRLLAVAPTARGQGVGTALMGECERRAQHMGATALTLHTTDIMRTAMRMYERMGFVRAPELDFKPAPNMLIKGFRRTLDNRKDERETHA